MCRWTARGMRQASTRLENLHCRRAAGPHNSITLYVKFPFGHLPRRLPTSDNSMAATCLVDTVREP